MAPVSMAPMCPMEKYQLTSWINSLLIHLCHRFHRAAHTRSDSSHDAGSTISSSHVSLEALLACDPVQLYTFPPATPQQYSQLARACLELDPRGRPSFAEVVQVLEGMVDEELTQQHGAN